MERREFLAAGGAAALLGLTSGPAWASATPADAALYRLMDRIFYDGLLISPARATQVACGAPGRIGRGPFARWPEEPG